MGAGDQSIAGWLASQFLGIQQPQARLQLSAACASVSCMHSGAYAPSGDEVTVLLSGGLAVLRHVATTRSYYRRAH